MKTFKFAVCSCVSAVISLTLFCSQPAGPEKPAPNPVAKYSVYLTGRVLDKDGKGIPNTLAKLAKSHINAATLDPNKKYGKSHFTYIDISAVENGTGRVSFQNRIKGIEAPSRARRAVKDGDVFMSTVRPNLKAFAYLENCPCDAIGSTGFAVLTPKNSINSEYLYFLLFSNYLQEQMISRMGKGAYPSINQTDVENLEIPVPDSTTQESIVRILHKETLALELNRSIIETHQQRITRKLSEIWGDPS